MTIFKSTIFDPSTGKIIGHGTHSGNATFSGTGRQEIVGDHIDGASKYVDLSGDTPAPFLADRPQMPCSVSTTTIASDGIEEVSITNVPEGATLTVDGRYAGVIDDGVVEFATAVAGQHVLVLSLFPYADASFTVMAT